MVKGNCGLLRDAAGRDVDPIEVETAWVVGIDVVARVVGIDVVAWVVRIDVVAWVEVVAPVFGFPLVPKFLPAQKDAIAVNRTHIPTILPMRSGLRRFLFTGRGG